MLEVVAGVLERSDGRLLVTERPAGRPLAGYLEFPGGKLEAGEAPRHGLVREFAEELGLSVLDARPLIRFEHAWSGRTIRLHVFGITAWRGEPEGREGQRIAWVRASELRGLRLLPADRPIVAAIELPATLLVTPEPPPRHLANFLARLEQILAGKEPGAAILRTRSPAVAEALISQLAGTPGRFRQPLLLNAPGVSRLPPGFAGLHLPASRLFELRERPDVPGWVGASVHDAREAGRARDLGLDYVLIGSIRPSPTHPGVVPLAWEGFARLAAVAALPAFAIGGVGPQDLPVVRDLWGQGVAAVRAFWAS